MEVIMRIWRTILAPAILAIGTVGALVSGPVLALTTAAAPVSVAAPASVTPKITIMHS
jgi:lysozyme family protein